MGTSTSALRDTDGGQARTRADGHDTVSSSPSLGQFALVATDALASRSDQVVGVARQPSAKVNANEGGVSQAR